MEEELMFNIDALNPRRPHAIVYNSESKERCIINLSLSIHLWHVDLVLAAYRLYWTGVGKRDPHLNADDGITYFPPGGNVDANKDMVELAKRIIHAICRNGRYDQPNLLRKINEGRYVLLRRDERKDVEVFAAGGYEKPHFFIRRIGSTDVIKSFSDFEQAVEYAN